MDEEETLTPVENTYIVHEGANEYYDVVNNVTYDMSSYTYDYSTRSYEVTYVDNNSVTQTTNVTYGDEYITVVNGGNTYNYYYIVTDSGSGEEPGDEDTLSWLEKIYDAIVSGFSGLIYSGTVDPSASPTYESKVITEPTCTRKGLTLYTNPATGDTYTEEIPALGHDWQLVDQIPDELDGEGNVVTAGYDLYRCSRCGEEYKDYDGTGPPGSDGGGTISSLVTELFRKLGELAAGSSTGYSPRGCMPSDASTPNQLFNAWSGRGSSAAASPSCSRPSGLCSLPITSCHQFRALFGSWVGREKGYPVTQSAAPPARRQRTLCY
jgi:hypothetical protein